MDLRPRADTYFAASETFWSLGRVIRRTMLTIFVPNLYSAARGVQGDPVRAVVE